MKKLILLIVLLVSFQVVYTQDNIFSVYLEGAGYDSLFLYNFRNESLPVVIPGIRKNQDCWKFTIPDSTYIYLEDFQLTPKLPSDREVNFIVFVIAGRNDTLTNNRVNFDRQYPEITARFIKSIKEVDADITPIHKGNIRSDYFELIADQHSDIHIRTKEPLYSTFLEFGDGGKTYGDFLDYYTGLAREYPDSRYLVTGLKKALSKYKTKKDVSNVFNEFSENNKNTVWGKEIQRYLYSKFPDNMLLSLATSKPEAIIANPERFNLIIFGASWCRPCIDEIPLLKELHETLKEKVDFTFVTIDEDATIQNWTELMKEHDIPWRSLVIEDEDIQHIRNTYFLSSIPKNILIDPDGSWEYIDVRNPDEVDYLMKSVF